MIESSTQSNTEASRKTDHDDVSSYKVFKDRLQNNDIATNVVQQ